MKIVFLFVVIQDENLVVCIFLKTWTIKKFVFIKKLKNEIAHECVKKLKRREKKSKFKFKLQVLSQKKHFLVLNTFFSQENFGIKLIFSSLNYYILQNHRHISDFVATFHILTRKK